MKNCVKNDIVRGLKRKITIDKKEKGNYGKMSFSYNGKYGQGYDGCGSHTHKD